MTAVAASYYPSLAVGDLVTADLLQSMVPKYYIKPSGESRNTTTTLADDSDLQGIALGVGTWEIELLLFYTQSTTNTQDLKTRWAFTGTWNNPDRNIMGIGNSSTASANVSTEVNMAGSQAAGQDAIYGGPASSVFNSAREWTANCVVTVAGNLSLQWAQNASSANNTTVQGNTAFRVRQIG